MSTSNAIKLKYQEVVYTPLSNKNIDILLMDD